MNNPTSKEFAPVSDAITLANKRASDIINGDERCVLPMTKEPRKTHQKSVHARYAGYVDMVHDRFLDRE